MGKLENACRQTDFSPYFADAFYWNLEDFEVENSRRDCQNGVGGIMENGFHG